MAVVLALDPGERRTGIALCDAGETIATPLRTHDRQRDGSLFTMLREICEAHEVARILVGHALTAHGTRELAAQRGERLVAKLREAIALPVELVDERFSSVAADQLLRGSRRPKEDRDALAAAFLLQGWLDARRGTP